MEDQYDRMSRTALETEIKTRGLAARLQGAIPLDSAFRAILRQADKEQPLPSKPAPAAVVSATQGLITDREGISRLHWMVTKNNVEVAARSKDAAPKDSTSWREVGSFKVDTGADIWYLHNRLLDVIPGLKSCQVGLRQINNTGTPVPVYRIWIRIGNREHAEFAAEVANPPPSTLTRVPANHSPHGNTVFALAGFDGAILPSRLRENCQCLQCLYKSVLMETIQEVA